MYDSSREEEFLKLIQKHVDIAVGCTEPISIALLASRLREILKKLDRVEIYLSRGILRNVRGVNIPNFDGIGVDAIFSVGYAVNDSSKGFSILKNIDDEKRREAHEFLSKKILRVNWKETDQDLYAEVIGYNGIDKARIIIAGDHDNFIHISHNDNIIKDKELETIEKKIQSYKEIKAKEVWDFALNVPLDKVRFILESARLNDAISQEGLRNHYRISVGKTYHEKIKSGLLENNLENNIVARTSAANDARMGGCSLPVFINSGSGNMGIASTIPVYVAWEWFKLEEEKLIRALVLSHFFTIKIRSRMGNLTPTCGPSLASLGTTIAILYLKGEPYSKVSMVVANIIGNISGIICDGAKGSCALKIATGIKAGFMSMMLSESNLSLGVDDGIVGVDVDDTINNFLKLNDAMKGIDETVTDIIC